MARRGSSRRTYVRDANGRFASTPGGGGPKRPATKAVKRGPNRLTRDNAGRITSQGGDGATVRGGRLKTAAGNLRGRQVAKLKTMQGVSYGKAKSQSSPLASAAATLRQSLSKAKTRADEAKARLAYKRVVRQELRNNPQNVLASNAPKQKRLPNQDSRMSRSKIRTVGNSKEQVQKRVGRKLYQAERALDRTLETRSRGLLVQDSIYQKQLKTSRTLKQASKFIKTGEMPKGDNSIAEKRKMADARERLIQKNKQRARERELGISSPSGGKARKDQLKASAGKRRTQADRIDKKIASLENQYRSKDAAFYTQGVKSRERDRMYEKSRQAAALRDQASALRRKADNAERMSNQKRGTAASKQQARRDAFDSSGYKVGDVITTPQLGRVVIKKINKKTVRFDKGNDQDKAFLALYLGLPT